MSNKILFEKYKDESLQELCAHLYSSSLEGNLEEVEYLLTSPDLKYHPAIHFANDSALVVSSSNGHIPVVEYLLNFSTYGQQVLSDCALIKACTNNELETAKFLLDSETIPYKANIHVKNDYIFRELMIAQNEEILKYLIFEREIPRTEYIDEYLNRDNYNLNDYCLKIKGWFELRVLNKELNTDLPNVSQSNKKIKL
jgi:hypothetical protein